VGCLYGDHSNDAFVIWDISQILWVVCCIFFILFFTSWISFLFWWTFNRLACNPHFPVNTVVYYRRGQMCLCEHGKYCLNKIAHLILGNVSSSLLTTDPFMFFRVREAYWDCFECVLVQNQITVVCCASFQRSLIMFNKDSVS